MYNMQCACTIIITIIILLCYEKKNYLISLTMFIVSYIVIYYLSVIRYLLLYYILFCEYGSSNYITVLYCGLRQCRRAAVRDFSHLPEQRLIK